MSRGGAARETRRRLLNAAIQAITEASAGAATTRRMADLAGVNEVTLFRHFGSKAGLLEQALRQAADACRPASLPLDPTEPRAEMTRWCVHWSRHIYEQRSLRLACLADQHSLPGATYFLDVTTGRYEEAVVDYLQALQRKGLARGDLATRAAARMLLGTLLAEVLTRRVPLTDEEVVMYVKMFLRVVLPK